MLALPACFALLSCRAVDSFLSPESHPRQAQPSSTPPSPQLWLLPLALYPGITTQLRCITKAAWAWAIHYFRKDHDRPAGVQGDAHANLRLVCPFAKAFFSLRHLFESKESLVASRECLLEVARSVKLSPDPGGDMHRHLVCRALSCPACSARVRGSCSRC